MGLIVPNIELVVVHFEPYVIGQPLQRNNWQGGNESPFQPLSLAIAPNLNLLWRSFQVTLLGNCMAYMVEAAMWAFKDLKRIGRVLFYAAFGNVMRWKLVLS
jgi:hypothetical protein